VLLFGDWFIYAQG